MVFFVFLFRHCSAITKQPMTLYLWAHHLSLPLRAFPLTTGTVYRTAIRTRKPLHKHNFFQQLITQVNFFPFLPAFHYTEMYVCGIHWSCHPTAWFMVSLHCHASDMAGFCALITLVKETLYMYFLKTIY